MATTTECIPGIHTAYAYVSAAPYGASFGAHIEDGSLYSMSYLVRGAPKFWVIVPPHAYTHLQIFMEHYQAVVFRCAWGRRPRCSQFLRHMHLWVMLGALKH